MRAAVNAILGGCPEVVAHGGGRRRAATALVVGGDERVAGRQGGDHEEATSVLPGGDVWITRRRRACRFGVGLGSPRGDGLAGRGDAHEWPVIRSRAGMVASFDPAALAPDTSADLYHLTVEGFPAAQFGARPCKMVFSRLSGRRFFERFDTTAAP